jgi:hypothetical protein
MILLRDFWSDSCRAEGALGLAGVRQRAFRDSETRQRSLASNHGRYHDLGLRAGVWPQSCRCVLFGARLPDGARHAALPHWFSPRFSQVRPCASAERVRSYFASGSTTTVIGDTRTPLATKVGPMSPTAAPLMVPSRSTSFAPSRFVMVRSFGSPGVFEKLYEG